MENEAAVLEPSNSLDQIGCFSDGSEVLDVSDLSPKGHHIVGEILELLEGVDTATWDAEVTIGAEIEKHLAKKGITATGLVGLYKSHICSTVFKEN